MYPSHWAKIFPDKPAAIDSETGESICYKELDDRSMQLANLMRARGLVAGDTIAIFMENNLRYFEVIWAALRSGLYLVTINKFLTAEEAAYIANDSDARLLVSSRALAAVADELPGLCPACEFFLMTDGTTVEWESYEEAIARHPAEILGEEPLGEFMWYSSGTTGHPKGVKRPLRKLSVNDARTPLGRMHRELWDFDEDTVAILPAPLYHSAPSGYAASTHKWGGTLVMMPRFDPEAALRAIETYKVTHGMWVPTMFIRMLKLPEDVRARYDLSSLKNAVHSAAPCPLDVKKAMFAWWGDVLYELYGGTELNGSTHATPQEWLANPGTVGKPLFGIIHICDDDGQELPANEAGTVYFEMPTGVTFKYHKDDAKTKNALHPDHPNWSALGDVGYVNERGFLFLVDRKSFMIISGGVNIYPQEIEDLLIQHPAIEDVAVIGVPNEDMGEEVKAVVQLRDTEAPTEALAEDIMAFGRAKLAKYKWPRTIDFIDELPRLPTGKLYKNKLRDKYWGERALRIN